MSQFTSSVFSLDCSSYIGLAGHLRDSRFCELTREPELHLPPNAHWYYQAADNAFLGPDPKVLTLPSGTSLPDLSFYVREIIGYPLDGVCSLSHHYLCVVHDSDLPSGIALQLLEACQIQNAVLLNEEEAQALSFILQAVAIATQALDKWRRPSNQATQPVPTAQTECLVT